MLLKERLSNNYDFLRVLAAGCITLTHSYNLLQKNADEPLMNFSGQRLDFSFIGLSIFFSVSGYLVAKSATNSGSFKNYIWKRFLRIQPLLIVVCFLSVFVVGPLFTSLSFSAYFGSAETYSYLRNIMPVFGIQFFLPGVFLNNPAESGVNGSLWTLVTEERLYIILSLLFLFRLKGKLILLLSILLLNGIYLLHYLVFHQQFIPYLTGAQVFYAIIFLNASCFYLLRIKFERYSRSVPFILILFGVIIISFFAEFSQPVQVILIPMLVICIAHLKGITNRAGVYGDFTYGIYIFSFPVQQMLIAKHAVNNNPLNLFLLTMAIVVPAAFVSWHLLEKKMNMLKNKVN